MAVKRTYAGNWLVLLVLVITIALGASVGCSRDPEVAKQRYLASGQRYFENGEFSEASIEFRNALKIDPQFVEAYVGLGLASRHLADWHEATKAFRRTLELSPEHTLAAVELAEIYLLAKAPKRVRELAAEILNREPKNVSARILLAKSYLSERNFPQAKSELQKAQQLEPENPTLHLAMGVAEIGAGDPASAETEFKNALALDKTRIETYQNLANLYLVLNRPLEAEQILIEGTRNNPADVRSHLALAGYYYRGGQLERVNSVITSLKLRKADRAKLYAEVGDFWIAQQEASRAVVEYQASLALRSSELVTKKLTAAYITLGDATAAERWNTEILERNPLDHQARMFRGAIAYIQNDTPTAINELRMSLSRDPASIFAHYYLGLAYLKEGKSELSRKQFYECIRLNEKFIHAFIRLGELSLRNNDPASAAEYAKRVIALNPRRVEGYLLAASAALLGKETNRAEQTLRVASRMAPEDYLVHEQWAALYTVRKNYLDAERAYQRALALSRKPEETLSRIVRFYIDREWTDRGVGEIEHYIASRGPTATLYELLAQLHLAQAAWPEAEQACQKALELEPDRALAHVCRGQALARQGRVEEARKSYERAIQLNPRQLAPYLHLADFYWDQGEFSRAGEYYRKALNLDSRSALAQAGLARALADAGQNLDWALSLAQQAKQQRPEEPFFSDVLAWVYHKKGLNDLAIPLLEECVTKSKKHPLFQYHLGMAYLQGGRELEARTVLQAALENGLEKPFANQAEKTLDGLRER